MWLDPPPRPGDPDEFRLADPHTCTPDAYGLRCVLCGIPAELVPPDELADALWDAYRERLLTAEGQVSWLAE